MAPVQDSNVTAITDIPLDDVLPMFGPANQVGVKNPHSKAAKPVQYLRQEICPDAKLAKAELVITAHGLYEAYVNGKAVTETLLNPGFASYDSFIEYQTYDVTDLMQNGSNCIGVKLADGWYKGKFGLMAFGANYGKVTSVLYCLIVTAADGRTHYFGSDESLVSALGPEEYSDFLEGEAYDSRKEISGWNQPGFNDAGWTACREDIESGCKNITAAMAEPVAIVERIPVKEIFTTPQGDTILDFGVNIAGFVEMEVDIPEGERLRLDHFENLDKDGNYFNSIFGYDRKQCVEYIGNGQKSVYHPAFTFFGFRYVKVSGFIEGLNPLNFTACVVSQNLAQTGSFKCSSLDLNQLQENILRSQKGNFISIPTDCPQRERAGWTGDVMVYCDTAIFNQDTEKFFGRWLKSVDAEQLDNGEIPIIVPYVEGYKAFQKPLMGADSSSGWGDVILNLPLALYDEYGDPAILEEQFPYMKKWMDHVEESAREKGSDAEDDQYLWNTGFHFGDWLYPSSKDENGNTAQMDGDFCTTAITATVFYAIDTDVMARVSDILGKGDLAEYYTELGKKVRTAFRKSYRLADGRMTVDLQGMYVLALGGNMLPEDEARASAARLNDMIIANDYCLDTGFMSIKFLMDVLQKYGYAQTACNVLYQDRCPSWLYEVKNGATTMWETWDAIRADGLRTPVSYNHYAFGCVGDWMYRELLGLKRLTPGWKTFEVAPSFDFDLTWAEGAHTIHGAQIKFRWEKTGNKISYCLNVPEGLTAMVPLETALPDSIRVNGVQSQTGRLQLDSGTYSITFSL